MKRDKILESLPGPEVMKMRLRTFAMLDAIVSRGQRSFEFHPKWGRAQQMGAFKDGEGNFFFAWFSPRGAVLRGFDHESVMSPFRQTPPAHWPGLFEGLPGELSYALREPAFALDEVTFCFWYTGDRWRSAPLKLPRGRNVDGAESLLACFAPKFSQWAAGYYGEPLDAAALAKVWWGREPIDGPTAAALNADFDAREVRAEAKLLGYALGDLASRTPPLKKATRAPPPPPRSFGAAEFLVRCEPTRVRMLIHGKEVVAETRIDVYEQLFDLVKAHIRGAAKAARR